MSVLPAPLEKPDDDAPPLLDEPLDELLDELLDDDEDVEEDAGADELDDADDGAVALDPGENVSGSRGRTCV